MTIIINAKLNLAAGETSMPAREIIFTLLPEKEEIA